MSVNCMRGSQRSIPRRISGLPGQQKALLNIQRDLNIALMNKPSIIFERMGLNTGDVLDAASTKWNFHRYSPGLVGDGCAVSDE